MVTLKMLLIVCPLVFAAGFIDAIAGGGGLIALPAYMLTGLPIHYCYGCNKFSGFPGTAMAAWRYYKNGSMHLPTALVSAGAAVAGAFCGARIALLLDALLLKRIFLFVLPFVAAFVLFFGKGKRRERMPAGGRLWAVCLAVGFFIGMYDGLIGPGTGTMLIFAYTTFMGTDYLTASGNAKIVNLASGVTSMLTYLLAGKVLLALALPAAACGMAGGYLGSGMAIKKGDGLVKGLLVVMLAAIFIKLAMDVF